MSRPPAMHHELIRMGAALRLTQLNAERERLLREFPGLQPLEPTAVPLAPKRHSAEARKRMSEGMRKHWARRKASPK